MCPAVPAEYVQPHSLIIPVEMLRLRVKRDFICKFSSGLFLGLPRLSESGISERSLFSGAVCTSCWS